MAGAAAVAPMIKKIMPAMDSEEPYHLDRKMSELQVSIEFSTAPFMKGATMK